MRLHLQKVLANIYVRNQLNMGTLNEIAAEQEFSTFFESHPALAVLLNLEPPSPPAWLQQ